MRPHSLDKVLGGGNVLALWESLEVFSPEGDGAFAVAEDGVGTGFVEKAVFVGGVLLLGNRILFERFLRLGRFEVGDAEVGADVGVVEAVGKSLLIGGDGLGPLAAILESVALLPGGLGRKREVGGGLNPGRAQHEVSAAGAEGRTREGKHGSERPRNSASPTMGFYWGGGRGAASSRLAGH